MAARDTRAAGRARAADRRTHEPSVRRCGGTESQALNRSAFGRGEGSAGSVYPLGDPPRQVGR